MEVQSQFGEDVQIIGIPGLSDVDSMQRFVEDTGTDTIHHIPDVDGVLWDRFGVSEQRTYVLVSDDGSTVTTGYGSLPADVSELAAG